MQLKALEIEKLRFKIAKLRRMQFSRSSERITRQIEHLELQLEELETAEGEDVARAEIDALDATAPARAKPKRKPLPDHLPRQEVLHQPAGDGACLCPAWGGGMGKLGEDVTEVLDYVPGHFQVIRHVRPKYACRVCDAITQAPAPAMPTPRGRATPAMLAHLLVSKYSGHLLSIGPLIAGVCQLRYMTLPGSGSFPRSVPHDCVRGRAPQRTQRSPRNSSSAD